MTVQHDTDERGAARLLTPNERVMQAAIDRDEPDGVWRCRYCRVNVGTRYVAAYLREAGQTQAVRDHVVPRALGGLDTLANIVTACSGCNVRKGRKRLEWLAPDWHLWRTGEDYEAQRRRALSPGDSVLRRARLILAERGLASLDEWIDPQAVQA